MPKWVVADLRILAATGKRKDFDRQLINDALIILSHGRRIHVCLRRVTLAAQMKKVHDLTNEETHARPFLHREAGSVSYSISHQRLVNRQEFDRHSN